MRVVTFCRRDQLIVSMAGYALVRELDRLAVQLGRRVADVLPTSDRDYCGVPQQKIDAERAELTDLLRREGRDFDLLLREIDKTASAVASNLFGLYTAPTTRQ